MSVGRYREVSDGCVSFAKKIDHDGSDKLAIGMTGRYAIRLTPIVQGSLDIQEFHRPKTRFEKIAHTCLSALIIERRYGCAKRAFKSTHVRKDDFVKPTGRHGGPCSRFRPGLT